MENLKVKTPELEDFLIDEIEKIAKSAGDIIKAHYTQGVPQ
jgi:myo-inositol-1(or 4)-monophosphatase